MFTELPSSCQAMDGAQDRRKVFGCVALSCVTCDTSVEVEPLLDFYGSTSCIIYMLVRVWYSVSQAILLRLYQPLVRSCFPSSRSKLDTTAFRRN